MHERLSPFPPISCLQLNHPTSRQTSCYQTTPNKPMHERLPPRNQISQITQPANQPTNKFSPKIFTSQANNLDTSPLLPRSLHHSREENPSPTLTTPNQLDKKRAYRLSKRTDGERAFEQRPFQWRLCFLLESNTNGKCMLRGSRGGEQRAVASHSRWEEYSFS